MSVMESVLHLLLAPYSLLQCARLWRSSPVAAYQSLGLGLVGLVLYGAVIVVVEHYI